jgi:hypothetical protein
VQIRCGFRLAADDSSVCVLVGPTQLPAYRMVSGLSVGVVSGVFSEYGDQSVLVQS